MKIGFVMYADFFPFEIGVRLMHNVRNRCFNEFRRPTYSFSFHW